MWGVWGGLRGDPIVIRRRSPGGIPWMSPGGSPAGFPENSLGLWGDQGSWGQRREGGRVYGVSGYGVIPGVSNCGTFQLRNLLRNLLRPPLACLERADPGERTAVAPALGASFEGDPRSNCDPKAIPPGDSLEISWRIRGYPPGESWRSPREFRVGSWGGFFLSELTPTQTPGRRVSEKIAFS